MGSTNLQDLFRSSCLKSLNSLSSLSVNNCLRSFFPSLLLPFLIFCSSLSKIRRTLSGKSLFFRKFFFSFVFTNFLLCLIYFCLSLHFTYSFFLLSFYIFLCLFCRFTIGKKNNKFFIFFILFNFLLFINYKLIITQHETVFFFFKPFVYVFVCAEKLYKIVFIVLEVFEKKEGFI